MPRLSTDSQDRLVRTVAPLMMLGGVFAVVVRMASRPLDNPDTYVHLRLGAEFVSGAWSPSDPGSVTAAATADWVPTQWLAQMVMASFEDWFGLGGVAWLSGLQISALVVVLYGIGRRVADPVVVLPVLVLALLGCAPALSMRPQVLSYLLFAVAVALVLDAQRDGRPRWVLVPLVAVWACLHGMWPVALVLSVVGTVGMALDRAADRRRLLSHAALPLLAAIAACLTPNGPAVYAGVLDVVGRRGYFTEWGPPDFTDWSPLAVVAMLVLATALGGAGAWSDGLVLLMLAGLLLYSTRTVPLAAVGLVPLTAASLQRHLGARIAAPRSERWVVGGGWAAALAVLALLVPRTADEPPAQPPWFDERLSALPSGTLVVTEPILGGQLMWRQPHLEPLMHGYADMFTDAELELVLDIRALAPGWDRALDGTGAAHAVLDPDSPLAYALETDPDWEVVDRSDDLVMLVRADRAG